MVDRKDIKAIAKARLRDAEILIRGKRFEGAIYLCGYVVELTLKGRICRTLRWSGYPASNAEFGNYKSFKTHDLEVLLHLSGIENRIKQTRLTEWSAVAQWDPESRYNPVGKATVNDAILMLQSAKTLLKTI